MSAELVEWGVRLTWPDGRTEDHARGDHATATWMADWHNTSGRSVCTATILRRTVTTSDWVDLG